MATDSTKAETIAARLTAKMDTGLFPAGSKLPSLRRLSETEACSVSTVVAAMDILSTSGRILSLPRSGIFVRSMETISSKGSRTVPRSLDVVRSRSHSLARRVLEMSQDSTLAPFHAAIPHPSLLPLASLGRHLQTSLSNGSRLLGSYSSAAGSPNLRKELARFHSSQGHSLVPSDLVITNGCMEALALGIEACSHHDDIVAIETPTFFGLIALLEAMGRKVVEIPCAPESGLRLDLLEKATELHKISALVVSPDVQNPTGSSMDLESRVRLVSIARRQKMTLIEDAVYSSCLFSNQRIPTLVSLWSEGVIHCSSASKILSPGLRIGWMAPGRWTERVIALKSSRTLGNPVALQDAFAGYLGSPSWPRHLRHFRRSILEQVQTTRNQIQECFPPGTRISQPHGGFFLWIEIPGLDSLDLFERALEKGIGILPGPVFSSYRERFRNCLRISCGAPLDAQLARKLRELGTLAKASIRTDDS
ncbi:MAG: PLP-dependent aminotransferase family protein [Fibrobacterota bacterium]